MEGQTLDIIQSSSLGVLAAHRDYKVTAISIGEKRSLQNGFNTEVRGAFQGMRGIPHRIFVADEAAQ